MSIVNTIFVLVEFAVHWWETMSIVNTIFVLVEFAVHCTGNPYSMCV